MRMRRLRRSGNGISGKAEISESSWRASAAASRQPWRQHQLGEIMRSMWRWQRKYQTESEKINKNNQRIGVRK